VSLTVRKGESSVPRVNKESGRAMAIPLTNKSI